MFSAPASLRLGRSLTSRNHSFPLQALCLPVRESSSERLCTSLTNTYADVCTLRASTTQQTEQCKHNSHFAEHTVARLCALTLQTSGGHVMLSLFRATGVISNSRCLIQLTSSRRLPWPASRASKGGALEHHLGENKQPPPYVSET